MKKLNLPRNYTVKVGKTVLTEAITGKINSYLNKNFRTLPCYLGSINGDVHGYSSPDTLKTRFKNSSATNYSLPHFMAMLEDNKTLINLFNQLPAKFNLIIRAVHTKELQKLFKEHFFYVFNMNSTTYLKFSPLTNFKMASGPNNFEDGVKTFTSDDFLSMYKHSKKLADNGDFYGVKVDKASSNTPTNEVIVIDRNNNAVSMPKQITDNWLPKQYDTVLTDDNEEVIFIEKLGINSYNNIVVCDTKYRDVIKNGAPIMTRLVRNVKPFRVCITLQEIADWKGCTIAQLDLV